MMLGWRRSDVADRRADSENVGDAFEDGAIDGRQRLVLERVDDHQLQAGGGRRPIERDQRAPVGKGDQPHAGPSLQGATRMDHDDGAVAEVGELRGRMRPPGQLRLRDAHDRATEVGVDRTQRRDHVERERQRDRPGRTGELAWTAAPRRHGLGNWFHQKRKGEFLYDIRSRADFQRRISAGGCTWAAVVGGARRSREGPDPRALTRARPLEGHGLAAVDPEPVLEMVRRGESEADLGDAPLIGLQVGGADLPARDSRLSRPHVHEAEAACRGAGHAANPARPIRSALHRDAGPELDAAWPSHGSNRSRRLVSFPGIDAEPLVRGADREVDGPLLLVLPGEVPAGAGVEIPDAAQPGGAEDRVVQHARELIVIGVQQRVGEPVLSGRDRLEIAVGDSRKKWPE